MHLHVTENQKSENVLMGKDVEVFLTTPLFRFRYRYENEERELLENAVRISGTVVGERQAGILMRVSVISNMKRRENQLPFAEIFLPFSKVDFIVVSS